MKIIELLNKIANGEEVPKKIKYDYKNFEFIEGAYEDEKGNDLCYYDDSCMVFFNNEVEILEEEKKIPEKITMRAGLVGDINNKIENLDINIMTVEDKLNEVIDYLKSKGE